RVLSGGTATLDYTDVSGHSSYYGVYSSGTFTANNSTITGGSSCLYVAGGNATFNSGTLKSCSYGVYTSGGNTSLAYNLITSNSSVGVEANAPVSLVHNTIADNPGSAVYIDSYTGSATVKDNIIVSNGAYGLHFYSPSTPSRTVDHNDVWSNSSGNYDNVSAGTGSISANPIFVSPGFNYTLQASSPCRGAASDGTDMGAFPYAPVPVAYVVVTPASQSLAVNDTLQFTATAYDAANNPLPGTTFVWSASSSAGTINGSGLFTAGCTPGTFTGAITATAQGKTGSASVTVTQGPPATVTVTPPSATVQPNGTQQFSATIEDACGNTLNTPVSWLVVAGGGSISTSGLFTAGTTPGTFTNTVRATSGSVSGFATVTVQTAPVATIEVTPQTTTLSINGTQQFTAVAKDASGNTVPATFTWSVVAGGGTISPSGLFTAGTTPGTFTNTVRATSGAISGYATVTVNPGPLASITVTPLTVSLSPNGVQQFQATGKDAAGNTVPVTPTWSVVNGGGTINSSGLFTAGATPGTFTNTVRATSGAISGYASVTITPGALASLTITPPSATLGINGTQQFTAVGKDASGNTVPATVTWSVVNGGGTISSSGLFTAGTTPGTFTNTVRATSGSITTYATVTVTPGALANLTITPGTKTLAVNGTQQFTATGTDSAGNTVPVSVTWSVVNGGGTITPTGLFTAGTTAGSFINTVKAVATGGNTAFASVEVTPGPVNVVEVTPKTVSLTVRKTQTFTATAKDAFGNVVTATPAWTLSPSSVGTIDPGGVFTAGGVAGSYPAAIEATVNGVTGTADVTLTPGPLATVTISPQSPMVVAGGTVQFNATGEDADKNLVSITPTWSVLNGAGTITQTGAFTASQTPGNYVDSIRAVANGITGMASVTVIAGGIARVEISPKDPLVAVKGTVQFTARAYDDFNNEVLGVTPTWDVIAGGGTIDPDGLFTAGEESGTFANTIQATIDGHTKTTGVVVATDYDEDGLPDEWELAHGLDPMDGNDATLDPDSDGLTNTGELTARTDPQDADTDDDGVLDGVELRPTEDVDGDGLVSGLDPDSDGDGIFDGTEMAVTQPHADTDVTKGFVPDADSSTSTDPMNTNTDGDARADGEEDLNHNGRVDPGETDPNVPNTFCDSDAACGGSGQCVDSVCVPKPEEPVKPGGCGCGTTGSPSAVLIVSVLLALAYGLRPRRAPATVRARAPGRARGAH
ncbi:MAG: right-handed parallel beta-helix repeat-containing protein, partial [Myxococcaceae bacterium]|nr:right-handed parallel beta-helix repeat-containing protein [Myxococcaceae bacterium]